LSKRDNRLLFIAALLIVSAIVFVFDQIDASEFQLAWIEGNDAYFEARFGINKPTDCFDCWPPLRDGWDKVYMGGFAISILGLLFCWWKPKT
jgi:hypothetical protein